MSEHTAHDLFARFQRNVLAGEPGLDEEICAENVVVETPFARRRIEGRANVVAMTKEGRAALPVVFEEFRDVVVHETADPEVIVVEYELVARVPASGKRASAPFVLVLRARDGRIVLWREYQDAAAIMAALA
ncbi:MAG: nuclear transport factor 2 family protein [Spirillospora sp.]